MIAVLHVMFCKFVAHHVDNFRRYHACLHNIFRRAELRRFCFFGFITLIREYNLENAVRKVLIREHLEEGKAVELRHGEVKEDDIGPKALPQARQGLVRGKARLDGIAAPGEFHPVHVQEEFFVVDEKNRAFLCDRSGLRCCICLHHTAVVGGSSPCVPSPTAAFGVSGSWSPASKRVLKPFTSENGICLSNAFIIASSCMVSMPCRRASAQILESTGLSRTIRSMSEDISSISNTAIRPRNPVGQVGVRFGSYTVFGTLKRYFSGSDSSCFSMPVRCDALSETSLAASGQKVRTKRCAMERIKTGGIRYGSTPMSTRR